MAKRLNTDVIVTVESAFNAFYKPRDKQYGHLNEDGSWSLIESLPEINLNLGVIYSLAHINDAFEFAVRHKFSPNCDEELPPDILRDLSRLYVSWESDTLPPVASTKAIETLEFCATLAFLISHEVGHYLVDMGHPIGQQQFLLAAASLADVLTSPEFQAMDDSHEILGRLEVRKNFNQWAEKIAADLYAYRICESEKDDLGDTGFRTLCAIQGYLEVLMLISSGRLPDTHPSSMIRIKSHINTLELMKKSGCSMVSASEDSSWGYHLCLQAKKLALCFINAVSRPQE